MTFQKIEFRVIRRYNDLIFFRKKLGLLEKRDNLYILGFFFFYFLFFIFFITYFFL